MKHRKSSVTIQEALRRVFLAITLLIAAVLIITGKITVDDKKGRERQW